MAFPSILSLAGLSASVGFKIQGELAGDAAGGSVASAGDFNGDGFDDILIGAASSDTSGDQAGSAYVIFGHAGNSGQVNLNSLNAATGFKITGQAEDDSAASSVASAGDINHDGLDDIIIGAFGNDRGGAGYSAGAAYVIFGKSTGIGTIDLNNLGTNGFKISGQAGSDFAGRSVASAGDVNNDGYADFIVGAPNNNGSAFRSGAAYVVFGKASGFGNIDLNTLSAADGFKISGQASADYLGRSVSSAGDVNGDGVDDILVGAYANDSAGPFRATALLM